SAQAAKLRHGLNEILAREKVAWKVYGEHSDWKIFFGAGAPARDGSDQSVADVDWRRLDAKDAERSRALRQALILGGVDFNGARALVSTCHTDAVIGETVAAFETAIRTMRGGGLAWARSACPRSIVDSAFDRSSTPRARRPATGARSCVPRRSRRCAGRRPRWSTSTSSTRRPARPSRACSAPRQRSSPPAPAPGSSCRLRRASPAPIRRRSRGGPTRTGCATRS